MHEDIRIVLRQRGYLRQPDGSYSKVESKPIESSVATVDNAAGEADNATTADKVAPCSPRTL